jgi:hypothetical protein
LLATCCCLLYSFCRTSACESSVFFARHDTAQDSQFCLHSTEPPPNKAPEIGSLPTTAVARWLTACDDSLARSLCWLTRSFTALAHSQPPERGGATVAAQTPVATKEYPSPAIKRWEASSSSAGLAWNALSCTSVIVSNRPTMRRTTRGARTHTHTQAQARTKDVPVSGIRILRAASAHPLPHLRPPPRPEFALLVGCAALTFFARSGHRLQGSVVQRRPITKLVDCHVCLFLTVQLRQCQRPQRLRKLEIGNWTRRAHAWM